MVLENEKKVVFYVSTIDGKLHSNVACQAALIYPHNVLQFHVAWLHFRRAKVGCVFGAVVCKLQARRSYVKS